VRFIDRKETHVELSDCDPKLFILKTFRSDVEQLDVAGRRLLEDISLNVSRHAAVDDSGGDAQLLQVIGLILHQRNERRYDESQSGKREGRQLEAKGLSTSGWHHRQDIVPLKNEIDDLLLGGPEVIKAESLAKKSARFHAPSLWTAGTTKDRGGCESSRQESASRVSVATPQAKK
jgi:hypothetical protein